MLENSDIEVHERYSQEQNTTEEFDDLIDVLVALKNGKIDEREAQATLKIEMGLTSDVAEKLSFLNFAGESDRNLRYTQQALAITATHTQKVKCKLPPRRAVAVLIPSETNTGGGVEHK